MYDLRQCGLEVSDAWPADHREHEGGPMSAQPKPTPRLLEKRAAKAELNTQDRVERAKCRQRSGGQCEVVVLYVNCSTGELVGRRCPRRASENHHLIGGSGRRNKGRSLFARHRLATCTACHSEITNHVLVPVNGLEREDAATVRYERVR